MEIRTAGSKTETDASVSAENYNYKYVTRCQTFAKACLMCGCISVSAGSPRLCVSRPHTTTCIPSAYQPAIPGILPILPIVSLRGICSAHVVAHIPRRPRAISGFYRLPKSHIACELGMSERQSPSSAFCRLKSQRSMVASDASV